VKHPTVRQLLDPRGFIAAFLLMTCISLLLSACAQLGVPTPQNTEERIVVTISAVTAARETATTLLTAKKISADDAQNVQQQADNLRAGAQIARSMLATDPAAADAKLQQTRAALLALQAYLSAKR
jgi:hypothetical protein